MSYSIYGKQQAYNLIVVNGLNSKNLVAQAECLDELADFIQKNGIDYSNEKEIKLIAKMADNPSKDIRENALKVLGEAYKILENSIWQAVGSVTPKVQGLLEARFKKLKAPGLESSASVSNFNTVRPTTSTTISTD